MLHASQSAASTARRSTAPTTARRAVPARRCGAPSVNAAQYSEHVLPWQTLIHITVLLSAKAIAYTDKLMLHAEAAIRKVDGRAKDD